MAVRPLREGFTTGTAACAAAMAALWQAARGKTPQSIGAPLPPFSAAPHGSLKAAGWLRIPVARAWKGRKPGHLAGACVIKDGGDDPDATNGAMICADLHAAPGEGPFARLEGGEGVGLVTAPGLAVPPGEPAINPVPRQQILFGLEWLHRRLLGPRPPFRLVISVPGGKKIAQKTMNPRLGVQGGISILGRRGIVRPFSHEAWLASVEAALKMARASGLESICLSTGRSSEQALMRLYPGLPALAFVQAGDLAAASLRLAAHLGFAEIIWGCFFGKLVKLAQGLENTHASAGALDMDFLARIFRSRGAARAGLAARAPTARGALEILGNDPALGACLEDLLSLARQNAEKFAGRPVRVHLFMNEQMAG